LCIAKNLAHLRAARRLSESRKNRGGEKVMTASSGSFVGSRARLLAAAIAIANFGYAGHATAQTAPQSATQDAATDDTKLEQIVVSA
jgi:hypothetical protein